jgi:peptide methionine sulfoxide reductase MsrA|tara:strand:+ start:170 stop:448 length:279 start_codon:yes stop_codon:yes gene_type:complete
MESGYSPHDMPHPSNEVLAEMIKGFRELVEVKFDENCKSHERTEEHLIKLNGKVGKNTKFRERWKTIIAVIAIVFGILVPVAQMVVTKIILK